MTSDHAIVFDHVRVQRDRKRESLNQEIVESHIIDVLDQLNQEVDEKGALLMDMVFAHHTISHQYKHSQKTMRQHAAVLDAARHRNKIFQSLQDEKTQQIDDIRARYQHVAELIDQLYDQRRSLYQTKDTIEQHIRSLTADQQLWHELLQQQPS